MTTPRPPRPLADLITASGLSRDTVKALIRTGQLPGYKAGRKYVIPADAFDAWCRGEWQPRPVEIAPVTPVTLLHRKGAA